ncbi:MAG TPA: acyl-CoA dehydrogenase family protein, partial [Thermomicrobiales bacterium]|nr:acyl-CoA dehydrogenase family protein [Thermomicrobiales bacterium]
MAQWVPERRLDVGRGGYDSGVDKRERRSEMASDLEASMSTGGLFELDDLHREFQQVCRDFVNDHVMPKVEQAERDGQFPLELMPLMGQYGFLGLGFPEEAGGTGGDMLAIAL